MVMLVVISYFLGNRYPSQIAYVDLNLAPLTTRLALSFILLLYGLTHAVAGLTVYLDTRVTFSSAQEYFFYIKPARLTGLSHAHLMGIATMLGFVAILYSLSRRSTGVTAAIVILTFIGVIGDVASWWAIKYFGGGYEVLSMISGLLFTGGFLVMAGSCLLNMWRRTKCQEMT